MGSHQGVEFTVLKRHLKRLGEKEEWDNRELLLSIASGGTWTGARLCEAYPEADGTCPFCGADESYLEVAATKGSPGRPAQQLPGRSAGSAEGEVLVRSYLHGR